ncbi:phage tail tape measure protein [Microbacterium sp.]|uniref:phage tail tape measure protein n=1 Tax=Microbacterium sp. TaxID=51671 RepID=UPI0039E6030C
MSDAFDARAELQFLIVGARQALNDLERVAEGTMTAGKAADQLAKNIRNAEKAMRDAGKAFRETGDAANQVKKGLNPDKEGSAEWQALSKKVREAEAAYRELAKSRAAAGKSAPNIDKFMAGQGITSAMMTQYRQGMNAGLVKDQSAQVRTEAKAKDELAAAENRLTAAQLKRQAAEAKESNRQMDARARAEAKAIAEQQRATQSLVGAQEKLAASNRNLSVAINPARENSVAQARLGVAEATRRQAEAQRNLLSAGADPRAQLAATRALTTVNNDLARAHQTLRSARESDLSTLPTLRYALYDVATTAGFTASAITALGTASVVAFASMQSSFTNVERTLDGVTDPAKVQALRTELVGLTREIPLAFADVAKIATLGNQLGVAADDVSAFTETVARFSAVTGLTAEASAQAFGSLGTLLDVQARDYEALGSSIALVGRRSVATEQEIVSMTTRLAASASNAGFTADQVVALSGAFASLRIAPERAQGVMEVYFNRLNTAISEGGPRLEEFGRIARVAGADVEAMVRSNPVEFFQRLATGLGEMDQIAQTGALDKLGLSGIRAGEVFGRVGANVGVFNKALANANQGWMEGTELGDQYGKVVDDLASRWQIFLNAIQDAGAGVGAALAGPLGTALAVVTGLLQGFAEFASNPIGGFFVSLIAILGGVAAALTGLLAAAALAGASFVAFRTAVSQATLAMGVETLTVRGLMGALTGLTASAGAATTSMKVLRVAMWATGIGIVVSLVGSLAGWLTSAADSAGGLSAELQPVVDGLNRAIDADTGIFNGSGEAVRTFTTKLEENSSAAEGAATAAQQYAGTQAGIVSQAAEATSKIEEQTRALGKNTEEFYRSQLARDEGFKQLANDPELRAAAEAAGFAVGELITSGMQKNGGMTAYIQGLRDEANKLLDEGNSMGTPLADVGMGAVVEQGAALLSVADALEEYARMTDTATLAAQEAGVAAEYAGTSIAGVGPEADSAASGVAGLADALFDVENAALSTESRMYALGSAVGENTGVWDIFSEAGRANLGALYAVLDAIAAETPGNAASIAANFQALYNTLIQGGYATASQLEVIRQKIVQLTGSTSVEPATRDFSSFFNGISTGAAKAAKAIGGGGGSGSSLKKEIRTLVDYANDLSGVWKRAFDIRFGGIQGLDDINSNWIKIANAADKAREAIEEHHRALADMAADRSIKQYWLKQAENYGDELRAAKLRAELSEIDADMAKEKAELATEQDKLNKSLVGNSEVAINNRGDILGLVGSYQNYLKSLAASGMGQAELQQKAQQLRAEFVQQAVSMGYNRDQVELYARSFDDMSVAIDRVPRNITVTANIDPALQALNEFVAKAQESGSRAGSGIASGVGAGFNSAVQQAAQSASDMRWYWESAWFSMTDTVKRNPLPMTTVNGVSVVDFLTDGRRRSGRGGGGEFSSGGYTGGSSASQIAGLVHGKEFVFSAAATRTLGVNNLAYMHNMAKSGKVAGPVGIGAAGSGVVDLSAGSARLLADMLAANLTVVLPGAQLAGSVGSVNVARTSRGNA